MSSLVARPVKWHISAVLMVFALSACDGGFDIGDVGPLGGNRTTAQTAPRPPADGNGVISYPTYQVIVAKRGDTVADLAARVEISADELARHNGLPNDYVLREGELLALPRRVATTAGFDIATIASDAIDSADDGSTATPPADTDGIEPIRHRVERGETAYSIARLYDVSVTSLARWNGLGRDLAVRDGQFLLIPVVENPAPPARTSLPGDGSEAPDPPSSSEPLPDDVETATLPDSPDLGQFKTTDANRKFLMPVTGNIITKFSSKTDGIDIAAPEGTAVKAAEDGTVALISKSVGQNTIVLLRHDDNILTVYSNVKDVKLRKGAKVRRGQRLGAVSGGDPAFVHFEVRRGTESIDPMPFLE